MERETTTTEQVGRAGSRMLRTPAELEDQDQGYLVYSVLLKVVLVVEEVFGQVSNTDPADTERGAIRGAV